MRNDNSLQIAFNHKDSAFSAFLRIRKLIILKEKYPDSMGITNPPYLTPDNNLAENAIRPFVLGRKNWLFAGSPKGAESSCGMYSLIETAKLNNLNPYEYLMAVFDKAPALTSEDDFRQLLPWNIGV